MSSLSIARALCDRLASGSVFDTWAATYGQAPPAILWSWRKPRGASDYPFVAVVPARDTQDLQTGLPYRITLAVVCGAHDPETITDGSRGLEMATGLWSAVKSQLTTALQPEPNGPLWVAETAELVDTDLVHPQYLIEHGVHLRLVGAP